MQSKYEFSQFEELGEAAVRQKLATNEWGLKRKEAAREWLALQESSERRVSNSDSLEIAKSAKTAAWVAAIAAIIANAIAILSLWISLK